MTQHQRELFFKKAKGKKIKFCGWYDDVYFIPLEFSNNYMYGYQSDNPEVGNCYVWSMQYDFKPNDSSSYWIALEPLNVINASHLPEWF